MSEVNILVGNRTQRNKVKFENEALLAGLAGAMCEHHFTVFFGRVTYTQFFLSANQ